MYDDSAFGAFANEFRQVNEEIEFFRTPSALWSVTVTEPKEWLALSRAEYSDGKEPWGRSRGPAGPGLSVLGRFELVFWLVHDLTVGWRVEVACESRWTSNK